MSENDNDDIAYLRQIQERYDRLHDVYDRTVLALGGGALALSITFASEIAGSVPTNTWKLAWSWGLLVVSVVAIALSYIPSIRSHRRVLQDKEPGSWGLVADVLSIGSGLLLAFGLGFLGWFALDNLTGVIS